MLPHVALINHLDVALNVRRICTDDGALLRSVRLAALQDAPFAFGSTFGAEAALTDAEWAERTRRGADGPDRATFLAGLGGQVVGLAGGYRDHPGSVDVELVSMWTAPGARRRGVGRALVQAVIDWATATSASAVNLWVTQGNDPAQRLYADMGFRETGESQPLPSDPSNDELRMTRPV